MMTSALRCKHLLQLLLKETVYTMGLLITGIIRRWKRLWLYLQLKVDLVKLSSFVTTLLIVLNITVYMYGINGFKYIFGPSQLPHGYSPAFPHHYFGHDIFKNLQHQNGAFSQIDRFLTKFANQNNLNGNIPPLVHIVWCSDAYFTFSDFLSVVAAFKFLNPSALYLHYRKEPELDPDGYYQFYSDLKRDIPPLIPVMLKYTDACSGSPSKRIIAYFNILGSKGGTVIDSTAVIVPSPTLTYMLNKEVTIVRLDVSSVPVIITAARNALLQNSFSNQAQLEGFLHDEEVKELLCENVNDFSLARKCVCVDIQSEIIPSKIFTDSSPFASLARWIGYGTSQTLVPHRSNTTIVPNIVHYVWLGEHELSFFAYLSVLSSIHVLKADAVYIHGDIKPLGDYWKEVEKDKRVNFIYRDFPESVFGTRIKKFVSHASDYLRADVLLRYGGVYADWDVLFIHPLSTEIRQHNTTVGVDWPETGAFPDVFNMGVLIAAAGAPFLRHFLESYRWYLDHHWSYNAIHMPYKVYEKVPYTVNIDRHVQVLCAKGKCHTTWLPGYKQDVDHLDPSFLTWRTDALAFHWTHPDPDEFEDMESLLESTSLIGQIGQYVLKKAHVLPNHI